MGQVRRSSREVESWLPNVCFSGGNSIRKEPGVTGDTVNFLLCQRLAEYFLSVLRGRLCHAVRQGNDMPSGKPLTIAFDEIGHGACEIATIHRRSHASAAADTLATPIIRCINRIMKRNQQPHPPLDDEE